MGSEEVGGIPDSLLAYIVLFRYLLRGLFWINVVILTTLIFNCLLRSPISSAPADPLLQLVLLLQFEYFLN